MANKSDKFWYSDIISTIQDVAPSIGASLGGLPGKTAGDAVSYLLGTITGAGGGKVSDKDIEHLLTNNKLSEDFRRALKESEERLKISREQSQLQMAKLMMEAQAHARERPTPKMLPYISGTVVLGFVMMCVSFLWFPVPPERRDLADSIFWVLQDGVVIVLSYYFGCLSDGKSKGQLLSGLRKLIRK